MIKRILTLAVITLLLAVAVGCAPTAAAQSEVKGNADGIIKLVSEVEGVENCVAIGYGDSLVVAVKCKHIFMFSQEKQLRDNIEQKIKDSFPEYLNVAVLTGVKDYYAVSGLKAKIDEGVNPVEVYEMLLDMLKRQDKPPHDGKPPVCPKENGN